MFVLLTNSTLTHFVHSPITITRQERFFLKKKFHFRHDIDLKNYFISRDSITFFRGKKDESYKNTRDLQVLKK